MSARSDLLTLLTGLDSARYTVTVKPPGSDTRILAGRGVVTVQRAGIVPTGGAWAHALTAILVVGAEAYQTAEDELEELLPAVVALIESDERHSIESIDRGVFFDGDSDGFHGYRITIPTITTSI